MADDLFSVFGRFWTRDELAHEFDVLEEIGGALSDRAYELGKEGSDLIADEVRAKGTEYDERARICKAVLHLGTQESTGAA